MRSCVARIHATLCWTPRIRLLLPGLGVPADELRDCRVALGDLWGSLAREARERLSGASSPVELFRVLEDLLRSRLRGSPLLHPAVAHAVRRLATCPQMSRIAEVQGETGYGAKRFIELFSREVGLTPKAYSRILRFQAVLNFGNHSRALRTGHPRPSEPPGGLGVGPPSSSSRSAFVEKSARKNLSNTPQSRLFTFSR